MKLTKKLVSTVLGLSLVACCIPMGASALKGGVHFGNDRVDIGEYFSVGSGVSNTKPAGDSYAYFDNVQDKPTLTLHNFMFNDCVDSDGDKTAIYTYQSMVIRLEGSNKIECPSNENGTTCGIHIAGDAQFTGDGSLTVVAGDTCSDLAPESYGIHCISLSVDPGVSITAKAGKVSLLPEQEESEYGAKSAGIYAEGSITASNANVVGIGGDICIAYGGSYGIYGFYGFNINGGFFKGVSGDLYAQCSRSRAIESVGHDQSFSGGTVVALGGNTKFEQAEGSDADTESCGFCIESNGDNKNSFDFNDEIIYAKSGKASTSNAMNSIPDLGDKNWYQWKTEQTNAFTSSETTAYPVDDYETISFANIIPLSTVYNQTLKATDATFIKGSDKQISFSFEGSLENLISKTIDDEIAPDNAVSFHETNDGKTQIVLNSSYLESLPVGKHTIKLVFIDKEITGEFTVAEKAVPQSDSTTTTKTANSSSPKTSDNSSPLLLLSLLLIAGCGLFAAKATKKE